jgi:hypothetical protein
MIESDLGIERARRAVRAYALARTGRTARVGEPRAVRASRAMIPTMSRHRLDTAGPRAALSIEGVDYSYDPPTPAGLIAAGKRFVVRYGAVGNPGKYLTATEVTALRAAGLDIVANAEETASAFRGTAAGVRHATAADAFFRKLGMPPHRPIYFSVDWDAQSADWPAVDAALRGAASVVGAERVGVYGSYDTVAHCAGAGTASWFWQTYAWSGGRWHPRAHLQQYSNNHALAGGTVDYDRAMVDDFGQWGAIMTFAPASCLAVRHEFQKHMPLADNALGIVGDDNHVQNGSSYHLGKSANRPDSYTIVESSRDRNGLSEAASANDIGYFSITIAGKVHTLRTFSVWLVGQCAANAADCRDIREVIYSPDGKIVKRWDDLGIRSTGDDTHLSHSHISWYRDSETHDRAAVIRRFFTEVAGVDMPITAADVAAIFNTDTVIPNRPWAGDASTNPSVTAATAIVRTLDEAHAAGAAVKALANTVSLNQAALLKAITNADDGAAVIAAVQAESAKLQQAAAEDAARDAATAAAIGTAVQVLGTIQSLLSAAGGDPDLAPVMAKLDGLADVIESSGKQAGRDAASAVLARLAAAQDAEAAALRTGE